MDKVSNKLEGKILPPCKQLIFEKLHKYRMPRLNLKVNIAAINLLERQNKILHESDTRRNN